MAKRVTNLARTKRLLHWVIRNSDNLNWNILSQLDWTRSNTSSCIITANSVRFSMDKRVRDVDSGTEYSIRSFLLTQAMQDEIIRLAANEELSERVLTQVCKQSMLLANDLFLGLKDAQSRDAFFTAIEQRHREKLRVAVLIAKLAQVTGYEPPYAVPDKHVTASTLLCDSAFRNQILYDKLDLSHLRSALRSVIQEHCNNTAVANIIATYCTQD